jgi:biotin operon repressor
MDYITYSKRLEYLIALIKNSQLHSPKQLAVKFGCSEKTIRRMINCLRIKGHEIRYCPKGKKYYHDGQKMSVSQS